MVDRIGQMLAACMLQHRLAGCIIDIDHSRLARLDARLRNQLKESGLGQLVILKCLMIIQVILGQIREYRRVELDTGDTVLVQRMRRDLHDHIVHALIAHGSQRMLKLHHIRSRVMDREYLILHHDLDCADKPDLIAGMTQDSPRDVACRRLAIRARNTDHTHAAGRVIMEERNNQIQRRLQFWYAEDSHARRNLKILTGCQHSLRTGLDCLRNEHMPIHMNAGNADEQRTIFDFTGIMLNPRNLRFFIADNDSTRYELCQLTDCFH